MTKILQVITRLNVGGPAQIAVLLATGLNTHDLRSTLVAGVTAQGEGDMSFIARNRGTTFVELPNLCNASGVLGNARAFFQIYRLLGRERPQVVHAHLMKARSFAAVAAKLRGVPVIIETFHGHLFSGYYGWLKTTAIRAMEMFLGWFVVDRVVALSERQKEDLLRYRVCPESKIAVIPLGLDLAKFRSCRDKFKGALRGELKLSENVPLIGIVGRLVPIKAHRDLFHALAKMRQAGVEFHLLVVGDGELRGTLEAQVRSLGLECDVTFVGWRFDLEKIYADMDVLVSASRNEGTPVALIEAMAAGLAVVATGVGGVPDMIQDGVNGVLVPPGDTVAMAGELQKLLANPDLKKRLGEGAAFSVYPRYDARRLLSDIDSLYRGLLNVP